MSNVTFRLILREQFVLLHDLSYAGPSVTSEVDSLLGQVFIGGFFCPERDREIEIRLSLPTDEERGATTLDIYRNLKTNPDRGLSVNIFLARRSPHLYQALEKALEVSVSRVMESVVAVYAEALRGPLLEIVKGDSWEDGFVVEWS